MQAQAPSPSLWLPATWQAPTAIIAGTSLSPSPLRDSGFNLAHHVQDTPERVQAHRSQLATATQLTGDWLWLNQIHSNIVLDDSEYHSGAQADAMISRSPNKIAVVMTADCLPILLCNISGSEVAAIHAGWQGLYQDIIANTIAKMHSSAASLFAWIGPCATQENYEVDTAFYDRFVQKNTAYAAYFHANRSGHYLADLIGIARHQLTAQGVLNGHISGGNHCSIAEPRFFSHRRNKQASGRMASFIAPLHSTK